MKIKILIIALSLMTLSACTNYNSEPPRVINPAYLKYQIPQPEPLTSSEQEQVNEIIKEYNQNTQ